MPKRIRRAIANVNRAALDAREVIKVIEALVEDVHDGVAVDIEFEITEDITNFGKDLIGAVLTGDLTPFVGKKLPIKLKAAVNVEHDYDEEEQT